MYSYVTHTVLKHHLKQYSAYVSSPFNSVP